MTQRQSTEPLVLVNVRLPQTVVVALRAHAEANSSMGHHATLSDALRAHITMEAVKPLGKPRPRRREPSLSSAASSFDPALMRQLAAIGSNLNQLARATNRGAVDGNLVQSVELLCALLVIERELGALVLHFKGSSRAH